MSFLKICILKIMLLLPKASFEQASPYHCRIYTLVFGFFCSFRDEIKEMPINQVLILIKPGSTFTFRDIMVVLIFSSMSALVRKGIQHIFFRTIPLNWTVTGYFPFHLQQRAGSHVSANKWSGLTDVIWAVIFFYKLIVKKKKEEEKISSERAVKIGWALKATMCNGWSEVHHYDPLAVVLKCSCVHEPKRRD